MSGKIYTAERRYADKSAILNEIHQKSYLIHMSAEHYALLALSALFERDKISQSIHSDRINVRSYFFLQQTADTSLSTRDGRHCAYLL